MGLGWSSREVMSYLVRGRARGRGRVRGRARVS